MSHMLSAPQRRELVDLLVDIEGLSKTAAKRILVEAKPGDLLVALTRLQQVKLEREGQARLDLSVSGDSPSVAPPGRPSGDSKAKKVPYTLLLPPEQLSALRALSERDDTSVSHHIRQAIRSYLRSRSA